MATDHDTASTLMLTGTVLACPDCTDERIFLLADCGDEPSDGCDYACTECGAAVSLLTELVESASSPSSPSSASSRRRRVA